MEHQRRTYIRTEQGEPPWVHRLFVAIGPRGQRACAGQPRVWTPPTDVYETDDHVVVLVEVAGVGEDSFTVQLQGRELIVAGCRHDPADKLSYQQMEINYGVFQSDVRLPCDVDETQAQASYDRGFLRISLPKARRQHKVPVVVTVERSE
jgi:HSP20 family protein